MKRLVSIIPNAPIPGRPTLTQGTRVVLDDGQELGHVRKITLIADTNDIWIAQIEVVPNMGVLEGIEATIEEGKPIIVDGVEDTTSMQSSSREYGEPA